MYVVERILVDGFWETHSIDLPIHREATFLIGANGTGKTTLINLLAAGLTADFQTLDRIPFKRMSIFLKSQAESDPTASIVVQKVRKKERRFDGIEYTVKSGARETKFSLEDLEEQYIIRRQDGGVRREALRRPSTGLISALQELVSVNWLSVHRAPSNDRQRDDRAYESAVDSRLVAISNDLVRYFATFSREKDDQVREFQEYIFVSLLEQQKVAADLFDPRYLRQVGQYEEALASIFDELHVDQAKAKELMDAFSERAQELRERLSPDGKRIRDASIPADEAIFLFGLRRIGSVVQRWNALQERLAEIFSQRDLFVEITNSLLQRKRMEISPSNELIFITRSDKTLTPQMLSSGEKQLLILLGETLLQRRQPAVFIADEPELSLHVTWQEQIVSSLRALNPSAQIIAATHSPDIVGPLADQAVDMEALIP